MDLRLLGPVEARVDDRPVELGPPKQRAVLAMLALRAGGTVGADRLVEGLWGGRPPASAPKMVQLYVSRLRRVMDGNGAQIVTRGRGYELHLIDGEVDVACFVRLLDGGRAREALRLWRGEPLCDIADEPFAAEEIRRLEELRLRAAESAVDADLAAGRHSDVIAELDALIAEHPLRERLHAQRMLALYRAGRQSEALLAYRNARAVLVDEAGVEPGGELRRLHRAILAHDPELDLAPPPRPAAAAASRRPRRRPWRLLGVAGAVAVAGLAAVTVSRVAAPKSLAGLDENAVGLVVADDGRIAAQYRTGHGPGALAAGAGFVWVANRLDRTVTRIDRARDDVVTVDVGGEPNALSIGTGSVWVAEDRGGTVAQIDPAVNKVVQRFHVGNGARALAVGFGAVWVGSPTDATVRRIDLRDGRMSKPIAVGAPPTALAAGAGAVWALSDATASVVRIDPASRRATATVRVGNGPSAVAVGAGAVWVANRVDGTVSRIDPATDRVTDAIRVGREPLALAADKDAVWVASGGDGTLARIDPRSLRADEPVHLGSSPAALAVVDGVVWTATVAAPSTHRGGTLRVVDAASPSGSPTPFDPITLSPNLSLVYDGLVAYRRAAGSAGGTLVPGLAQELPGPAPDGLTYEFRLRPGVRFSTGAPVRPADVRASLERLILTTAGEPGFRAYLPIEGAAGCTTRRCDLSEGIRTDAAAGTVSIRLTRPDPDFLHKLVNALVLPSGTPAQPAMTRPAAGTGPYMLRRWDPRRGGLLVRNPHFRARSPDRPDGFPDRIEIRLARPQEQFAAMEAGTADIATLGLGLDRVVDLRTRYGARLHTDPFAQTWYLFLDLRRPPFDDRRVRLALNYAVDRERVADLLGTLETHRPTCQLLPPGFQGYTPSCPFTAGGRDSPVWTGPDLTRARRLVAESGTRGADVTFWGSEPWAPLGRYFRSLLRRLGYRAHLRTVDDLHLIYDAARSSRQHPQIGLWGWIADSAGPYTFLSPLVSCEGDTNLSRFCNPAIDAQMTRAAGARGPQAIQAWRRVEAALTEQAPVVPLLNESSIALTARRVGNYQHHPLWGPLLDQLWVR